MQESIASVAVSPLSLTLRLLHFVPSADLTLELPFTVIDMAFQLHHLDLAPRTGHFFSQNSFN